MSGRKTKGLKILPFEGLGKKQKNNGVLIEQISCRYQFPKYPLDKTEVLYALKV
jgi:hypothetical protein